MEWLSQNWIWVLVAVLFIAMHFGHGGHAGGCGGGHRRRREGERTAGTGSAQQSREHQH
jgi:hypothetical protein